MQGSDGRRSRRPHGRRHDDEEGDEAAWSQQIVFDDDGEVMIVTDKKPGPPMRHRPPDAAGNAFTVLHSAIVAETMAIVSQVVARRYGREEARAVVVEITERLPVWTVHVQ